MKKPFVTAEQLEDIAARYPTPFHLYDAQGIRENARRLKAAFSWNPGYREYFAVKATPTPAILKILQKEGCGCDCSSLTELMMAERIGSVGENIMFSSNETPAEDYRLAAKLGAIINLDDITHVDFLEKTIGYIPKRIGCRFNPGGTFSLGESREGFQVMDNPGDAKYGMTREQITQAFRMLKARARRSLASTHFWHPTPCPMNTIPRWRAFSSSSRSNCSGRPAAISRTSTSPAAWASRIGRRNRKMTLPSSVRACARCTRRSSSRPAWAMWPCARSSAASCSRRMVIS